MIKFILFLFLFTNFLYGDVNKSEFMEQLKSIDKAHSYKFSKLLIQYNTRIQPINTLSSKVIRKISGKNSISNIYPELDITFGQTFLGMLTYPQVWQKLKFIKIHSLHIKEILNIPLDDTYASFTDFFDYSLIESYKLADILDAADKKMSFKKEALELDKKINMLYDIYSARALKIFPYPKNENILSLNAQEKWHTPKEAVENFPVNESIFIKKIIPRYFSAVYSSSISKNWVDADDALDEIFTYQKTTSSYAMDKNLIQLELFYNSVNIFSILPFYFLIIGFYLLFLFSKKANNKNTDLAYKFVLAGFIIYSIFFAIRAYLQGYFVFSSQYDFLLYLSWVVLFVALIISKKLYLPLGVGIIVSAILLFFSYFVWLEPPMDNVIASKRYLQNINIMTIFVSYGVFIYSFSISIVSFFIRLFIHKSKSIYISYLQLRLVNEMLVYIGLLFLVISYFLGTIWINESFEMYNLYIHQEIWIFASIIAYSLVLGLRFVPFLHKIWLFNIASMFAFVPIFVSYFFTT